MVGLDTAYTEKAQRIQSSPSKLCDLCVSFVASVSLKWYGSDNKDNTH